MCIYLCINLSIHYYSILIFIFITFVYYILCVCIFSCVIVVSMFIVQVVLSAIAVCLLFVVCLFSLFSLLVRFFVRHTYLRIQGRMQIFQIMRINIQKRGPTAPGWSSSYAGRKMLYADGFEFPGGVQKVSFTTEALCL